MTGSASASDRVAVHRGRLFGVRVPMRDGVELATDVHFPAAGVEGGPYPALVMRTPYGRQRVPSTPDIFTAAGYAVAVQDVRGRHDSDGEWYPLVNEGRDGYDAIEWVAAQDWCDGRVGTMGGSYPGYVQWAAARERPPHLRAMAAAACAGWIGRQEMYNNGVLFLATLTWLTLTSGRVLQHCSLVDWRKVFLHLPVREMDAAMGREMPIWRDWLDHWRQDEYWTRVLLSPADFAGIDVPVLHISGWFDSNLGGTLFFYGGMREYSPAADRQALVVGPWNHGSACSELPLIAHGGVEFSANSILDLGRLRVRWFDRWLKGEAEAWTEARPASRLYMTGAERWRDDPAWPPAAAISCWYLRSRGRANTQLGDGELSSVAPGPGGIDTYVYDPEDPVILIDNWDFYGAATDPVPPPEFLLDRRPLERRDDALVYTSPTLSEALDVVGVPEVVLFASSDSRDTDWFAWLNDVAPGGRSLQVATGLLRARFRDSLAEEKLLVPHQRYEFRFELTGIAHSFEPGHRIRLVLSSSNFPLYDRNPNTGHPTGADAELRVATNRVFHGGSQPSRVELPCV